jgi:hypothetical protein
MKHFLIDPFWAAANYDPKTDMSNDAEVKKNAEACVKNIVWYYSDSLTPKIVTKNGEKKDASVTIISEDASELRTNFKARLLASWSVNDISHVEFTNNLVIKKALFDITKARMLYNNKRPNSIEDF